MKKIKSKLKNNDFAAVCGAEVAELFLWKNINFSILVRSLQLRRCDGIRQQLLLSHWQRSCRSWVNKIFHVQLDQNSDGILSEILRCNLRLILTIFDARRRFFHFFTRCAQGIINFLVTNAIKIIKFDLLVCWWWAQINEWNFHAIRCPRKRARWKMNLKF